MATKYIKIIVNSQTVSDQTTKRCLSFSYTQTFGNAISNATVVLKRTTTTEDLTNFISGKSIQVYIADTLTGGQVDSSTRTNIVFDGYITDPQIEFLQITLNCSDRLVLSKWEETGEGSNAPTIYNGDVYTAFSSIVGIVASASLKTLNIDSGSTGRTLNNYTTNNNVCYEKLFELPNMVNWQFYYKPLTDKVIFEPRGTPALQSFHNTPNGTNITVENIQPPTTTNWSSMFLCMSPTADLPYMIYAKRKGF